MPNTKVPSNMTSFTMPTMQRLTTGTLYTTPVGVKYIEVEMVGGGSGGSSSGTAARNSGAAGGNTTFSTFLTANGAGATQDPGAGTDGADGGTATTSAPAIAIIVSTGAKGSGVFFYNQTTLYTGGPLGANTPIGGATSGSANVNTGCGGRGGGTGAIAALNGLAGGGGGYIKAIIADPSATYAFAIGAGGSGGAAGTSGNPGGNGGSGIIIVREFYQ